MASLHTADCFHPSPVLPTGGFLQTLCFNPATVTKGRSWWAIEWKEPQLRPCGKTAQQVFNTIKTYLLHREMRLGSTPNKLGQVEALKGMSVLSTEGLKLI